MQRAVFLDRDGTMVHDVGYLSRLEDIRWFPWTIDAIRVLNRSGFLVIVTTNQGGIGLGFYTEDFLRRAHDVMAAFIDAAGARVDAWFYCPHHPLAVTKDLRVECDCRKPRPGMIRRATERFKIDLAGSFVIGDKAKDVKLAGNVGARGILVRTGYGEIELQRHHGRIPAAHVAHDLMSAAAWIVAGARGPRERA